MLECKYSYIAFSIYFAMQHICNSVQVWF